MTVTKRVIQSEREKMMFLTKKLSMVRAIDYERTVFSMARRFSQDYSGGLWEFADLSNDGFFMYPYSGGEDGTLRFINSMNGSDVTVSPEAFGVIVSLIALSALSFEDHEYADRYHQLLDYARTMDERAEIYAAID